MKKIFLLLLLSMFFSCVPIIKFIPKSITTVSLDFTKYSKVGFLITSGDYSGDYEAIGLISCIVMPEAELTTIKNTKSYGRETSKWEIKKLDWETIIDPFYEQAIGMDANAIINLKVTTITETYNELSKEYGITLIGFELNGFAIKRLGAFK